MGSYQITPEEAAADAYDVSIKSLAVSASVYQKVMTAMDYLSDKTDNALGRFSGLSYNINSYKAMVECVKGVETKAISDILTDPDRSFKDKIRDAAHHVSDKFTHESTVAAGFFFGKGAVVEPVAFGVGAAVALMTPISHAVAGYAAYKGIKMAACYFLSTHHGHHLECKIAEKIKEGCRFLRGAHRAASGADPEFEQTGEMAAQLDQHVAHHHKHDHGKHHHHHHHHVKHTLKEDLKSLGSVFIKPKALVRDAMAFDYKQEFQKLKQVFGKEETVSVSPLKSKFSTPVISAPVTEDKARPVVKAQTMKL